MRLISVAYQALMKGINVVILEKMVVRIDPGRLSLRHR